MGVIRPQVRLREGGGRGSPRGFVQLAVDASDGENRIQPSPVRSVPLYLQYYFWLLLVSALIFALERLFPLRPRQPVLRDDLSQDLFWLVFNTQFLGWMLAIAAVHVVGGLNEVLTGLGLPKPESLRLAAAWPWWTQAGVFFLLKDFLEWNVHRCLHLVPWLWRFHQLHHSSTQLDWLSTFRAHWGEVVIYKIVVYLPLVVLGVEDRVVFGLLVFSLVVQELIHANLNWDWGPLRYVFNSPRLHAWHHAVEMHGRGGQNFGINLSIWDWIFRTVYWPKNHELPRAYGFTGMEEYPRTVWARLREPFRRRR